MIDKVETLKYISHADKLETEQKPEGSLIRKSHCDRDCAPLEQPTVKKKNKSGEEKAHFDFVLVHSLLFRILNNKERLKKLIS